MSRYEFKLPDIGEGVTEGEIVKWLVQPGEAVSEDQPIVEVMTDKATVTITSPKRGKVVELGGKEGATIAVHSVLLVLDLGGDGKAASATPKTAEPTAEQKTQPGGNGAGKSDGPAATAVGDIREDLPGMRLIGGGPSPAAAPVAAATTAGTFFQDKPLATPATRKLARDLGVDLRTVRPSGAHGRVLKEDVQRAAGSAAPAVAARSTEPVRVPVTDAALEVRRPLKGVRKRIFDSMARSVHTAAHFTFVEECDMTRLKAVRERLRPIAKAEHGVKLTYLPFFVKAAVAALKKHPALNSAFDEATQEIVEKRYFHIGIASATEQGLMVPVVKHADKLSLLEVAREIQRLGDATKAGAITPDDLRGSTFTITSLGEQGGLFATPILNLPEVGILGVHRMKERPLVKDGQIVIGSVALLSLSFDHRLIDGHVGAAFAYELISYLEAPEKLWLEG
jgi:pyruvate/2-oxoglutarate dehydrogenase complex dihydrolipoamide acyltransferase (E2) component